MSKSPSSTCGKLHRQKEVAYNGKQTKGKHPVENWKTRKDEGGKMGLTQVDVCEVSLSLGRRIENMFTNRRGYRQSFFSVEVIPPVTIENYTSCNN